MPSRLRSLLIALPFVVATALAAVAASSCGSNDDDETCHGHILTTCSTCTCPTGETTTCTAYPVGDEGSNERCCTCSE